MHAGRILIFGVMALLIIGTAVGMLLSRNAVYSALFLVLNFCAVAVLYLVLGAPFIALAQVTVYAGAIMVLFLFVIMLLGAERLGSRGHAALATPAGVIGLGVVLLAEVVALVVSGRAGGSLTPMPMPPVEFASPAGDGHAAVHQVRAAV